MHTYLIFLKYFNSTKKISDINIGFLDVTERFNRYVKRQSDNDISMLQKFKTSFANKRIYICSTNY